MHKQGPDGNVDNIWCFPSQRWGLRPALPASAHCLVTYSCVKSSHTGAASGPEITS